MCRRNSMVMMTMMTILFYMGIRVLSSGLYSVQNIIHVVAIRFSSRIVNFLVQTNQTKSIVLLCLQLPLDKDFIE